MKIIPLAFDSMGTRSMATKVVCDDLSLMVDPSASLAPKRYGLPPSEVEWKRLNDHLKLIGEEAKTSQVLVVTHYHYDHHNPDMPDIFREKWAMVKDPKENINKSQKQRAARFLELIEPEKIGYCDSSIYEMEGVKVEFSRAVPHGSNSRLGYVVEVLVEEGDERVVFTSDVEGPVLAEQVDFIVRNDPHTVIADGPMTYMLGYRYSGDSLRSAISNLKSIIEGESLRDLVLDHHFMRDLKYKERPGIPELYDLAHETGIRLTSAAELAGKKVEMLEALRRIANN